MDTLMPVAAKAAIRGMSVEHAWQRLANGQRSGEWGWDALEAFHHSIKAVKPEPKPKMPPKTRLRRWDDRPKVPTERFITRRSVDATIDWEIPDGAYRCLDLILSLAGGRALTTYTSSLAKQLGRTTRTVQNYYRALVSAGYVIHAFDRRTGVVTLTPTARCRPAGGAKIASAFNRKKIQKGGREAPFPISLASREAAGNPYASPGTRPAPERSPCGRPAGRSHGREDRVRCHISSPAWSGGHRAGS